MVCVCVSVPHTLSLSLSLSLSLFLSLFLSVSLFVAFSCSCCAPSHNAQTRTPTPTPTPNITPTLVQRAGMPRFLRKPFSGEQGTRQGRITSLPRAPHPSTHKSTRPPERTCTHTSAHVRICVWRTGDTRREHHHPHTHTFRHKITHALARARAHTHTHTHGLAVHGFTDRRPKKEKTSVDLLVS